MKLRTLVPALLAIGCLKSQSAPVRDPFEITVSVAPKKVENKVPPKQDAIMSSCPDGMVQVKGNYCPVVEEVCEKWIDDLRCAKFKSPTKCLSPKRVALNYCMDVFEWPNKEGSLPEIGFDWYGAKARCEGVGKRLCEEDEWNFACEGEDIQPYAYGYQRDASVCNVDKPWLDYTKYPRTEWFKLYQGVASDSKSPCKSWAGVINMNGNVDEIINAPKGNQFKNESTGGYWGPIRGRCRPKTTAHDEHFGFYQTSTRCCSSVRETQ